MFAATNSKKKIRETNKQQPIDQFIERPSHKSRKVQMATGGLEQRRRCLARMMTSKKRDAKTREVVMKIHTLPLCLGPLFIFTLKIGGVWIPDENRVFLSKLYPTQ